MLECYRFQNICPIEYVSLDFIAFFAIARLNEKRKGTKRMKGAENYDCPKKLKNVNKKKQRL